VWGSEQVVEVDEHPLRVARVGTGTPLLLINGIGASAEMWAPLISRLDGHELVAVDLPGTGSSPHSPRPLRIRGLARLVEHVLDALGYDTIDVLGYSLGGIVVQELARRAPGRLERLVLCATSPGLGGVPPSPLAALLMLSPARYYSRSAAERILPVIAGGRTRRDHRALEDGLAQRLVNPPSTRGYFDQLYAVTGWSSLSWLRQLKHETLILHGDDDPLVPIANARRMAAMIPRASLTVVRGGGHLFLLDEPESVVGDLARFLARISS
jgi:pimeloyl-ACP methyl ester carboxylesterase